VTFTLRDATFCSSTIYFLPPGPLYDILATQLIPPVSLTPVANSPLLVPLLTGRGVTGKFAIDVNDAGGKFAAGVNNTGRELPSVSMMPEVNDNKHYHIGYTLI
jgi:hypothetical protein